MRLQDFNENIPPDINGRGFFTYQGSPDLLLFLDDSFLWNGIAIEEGHRTPCVRHAMLGIAALVRGAYVSPNPGLQFQCDLGEPAFIMLSHY